MQGGRMEWFDDNVKFWCGIICLGVAALWLFWRATRH